MEEEQIIEDLPDSPPEEEEIVHDESHEESPTQEENTEEVPEVLEDEGAKTRDAKAFIAMRREKAKLERENALLREKLLGGSEKPQQEYTPEQIQQMRVDGFDSMFDDYVMYDRETNDVRPAQEIAELKQTFAEYFNELAKQKFKALTADLEDLTPRERMNYFEEAKQMVGRNMLNVADRKLTNGGLIPEEYMEELFTKAKKYLGKDVAPAQAKQSNAVQKLQNLAQNRAKSGNLPRAGGSGSSLKDFSKMSAAEAAMYDYDDPFVIGKA